MKTAISIAKILHFLLAALLVVACGGGGGGGGGGVVPPPAAGVSITAANAELITAEVLNSVNVMVGVSGGPIILTGVAVSPAAGGFNYPDFFVKQLQQLPVLASQSNSGSVTGVVIPAATYSCTGITGGTSGTYLASGEVSNLAVTTVGDSISVDFNNCVVDGIVLNGAMSLVVTAVTGGFDTVTPPYSLGVDAVLSAFSANDAGYIVTGDGDLSMLFDESISGDFTTLLSGTSLLASAAGNAEQLTNYQFDITGNDISGDFSVDLIGTIATTLIGGSVSFDTMTAFTGNELFGTGDPTAGVLQVTTSADASQALVTAQPDGINLEIDVDADGDSLYEDTIMTTWTALQTP
jgi:hypothetical protein